MRYLIISLVWILGMSSELQAQTYTIQYDIPMKSISGYELRYAWMGGLNNPEFSNIDLNHDGVMDVFIFDKVDGKTMTFVQDAGTLRYNDNHGIVMPSVNDWCLLKDFNCDEIPDIFTYSVGYGGAKIYKGYLDAYGAYHYALYDTVLNFQSFTGYPNIYISQVDLVGLADFDNDTDMDILTFSFTGQFLELYKNYSAEYGYGCDTMIMKIQSACWGGITESLSDNTITTDISCRVAEAHTSDLFNTDLNSAHSGSSILAFDPDHDADIDVLLGDVSSTRLVYLENTPLGSEAHISAVTYDAPAHTLAADVNIFAAPFYVDIDGDAKNDLLVASNATSTSKYLNNISYYKNIGTVRDSFVFQEDSFLVKDMIDVGKNAYPEIIDVDGDGLLDLILGNNSYYGYPSGSTEVSALTYYRNIGTATQPAFQLISRDWAAARAFNKTNLNPSFGDLDGDGDQDMLLGNSDGKLIYLRNAAGVGNPMIFDSAIPYFDSIDVGTMSAPQIIDVDEDGLQDLLIGEIQGRIFYYRNIGSSTAPHFTLISSTWGDVDVRSSSSSTGYSKPLLYKDPSTNTWRLLVGSEQGAIYLYNNISGNLSGTFLLDNNLVADYQRSRQSDITRADLNQDGYPELLIGTIRGGLYYYTSDPTATAITEAPLPSAVQVVPNPAKDVLTVLDPKNTDATHFFIYDIQGMLITHDQLPSNNKINICNLSAGIYVLQLKNNATHSTFKFLKVD